MTKKTENVAILGLGLLGGSLAKDLKRRNFSISGWSRSGKLSDLQKKSKIFNETSRTPEGTVKNADIVILSTHPHSVPKLIHVIFPYLKPKALVMDVSSVKREIVDAVKNVPGISDHFVPCHPMAGREKSGFKNSIENLYRGRTVFITPFQNSPQNLINRATKFWEGVGGEPHEIDPNEHDRIVALTSHLPHLLSSSYMNLFSESLKSGINYRLGVGTGFRDFTRIAASNPEMWNEIFERNEQYILHYLILYIEKLHGVVKNLKKKKGLLELLERASSARNRLL